SCTTSVISAFTCHLFQFPNIQSDFPFHISSDIKSTSPTVLRKYMGTSQHHIGCNKSPSTTPPIYFICDINIANCGHNLCRELDDFLNLLLNDVHSICPMLKGLQYYCSRVVTT